MIMISLKQKKIKFKPRIKLNHNIYMYQFCISMFVVCLFYFE